MVKKGFGTQFVRAQEDHFYFSYPEQGWTWDEGKTEWTQAPFDKTPHGYSGGGCWAFVQPKLGDLFTPERHIRLYGIQSAWDSQKRHVKCVPIAYWLTLVGSCCPDLRPAIANRFPNLFQ